MHKLYLAFPKYIENYYKYFVRKYILREKVENKKYEDKELDLSCFGNYVFILVTNKTLKSFEETKFLTKKLSFKGDKAR